MKKIVFIAAILLALAGTGGFVYSGMVSDKEAQETVDPRVVLPEVIELQGVINKNLTARATQAFAAKEVQAAFLHTIRAQLPEKPDKILSYSTWIAKPDRSHYIKTGQLIRHPDGVWKMDYNDTRDLREYSLVIVTSETEDDGRPETEILVGEFEKPKKK